MQTKLSKRKLIAVMSLILACFIGSGAIGYYYSESQSTSKLYLFNNLRHNRVLAIYITYDNRDQEADLSRQQRVQISKLAEKTGEILQRYNKKVPVIMTDKDIQAVKGAIVIDITNDVLKEVIGAKEWEELGKFLLNQ